MPLAVSLLIGKLTFVILNSYSYLKPEKKCDVTMEGTIVNYRLSRHVQKNNEMIVVLDAVTKRADAQQLVGKKVTYTTAAGKVITGTIVSAHGNKGAVRVRFEKGMPGQALAKKVIIG